jgi:muramoyltetrapeptide carboxypeptidase
MLTPPFLKKGDTIAITATARKISPQEVNNAVKLIEQQGYQVKLAPHLFAEENQFAGSDAQRKSDLQTLINDTTVKAIIIARGGYGTMRIIDEIDFTPLQKYPKWLIGYSDVTVLHSALHLKQLASLHATMPINFDKNEEATDSLFKTIAGEKVVFNYNYQTSINAHLFRQGKTTAQIVGGNLSLLYAMQGSATDIDTNGKILFIEDLDEYLYHVDRMVLSLKRAGKFDKLAGLVIGGMSDMKDNSIPFGKTAEEIIAYHLSDKNYPICFDFPCGHIDRNLALLLGLTATLDVNQNTVSLQYIDGYS